MEHLSTAYKAMSGDGAPEPDRTALRLGVPEPWYEGAPIGEDVRAAFEGTVAALRSMGHEVHPIQMPDTHPSRHLIAALEEVASVHREFRLQGKHYSEAVETRIVSVEQVSPEAVAEAREWQQMLRQRFADAFATVDFLITPTCAASRKVIGQDMIGDKDHRSVLSYFSSIVNHALHPALAVPVANSGAPSASLQVIGALQSEQSLIGFGRWLEDVGIAGFTPPPRNSPKASDG
jgi:Asp-tRNA(Asn)/Glu-tRNA(Gln) amidotransferase A subunit family amidase